MHKSSNKKGETVTSAKKATFCLQKTQLKYKSTDKVKVNGGEIPGIRKTEWLY